MARLPDWEERLHDYLTSCADRPFVYGEHDCALFSAGAVIAVTGEDPAAAYRGRYRSAAGSVRALRVHGAGTLETTLAAGFPDRASAFAHRGDLALVERDTGPSVGVVIGADALFVGEEDGAPGLVRLPRADWRRCWAVG